MPNLEEVGVPGTFHTTPSTVTSTRRRFFPRTSQGPEPQPFIDPVEGRLRRRDKPDATCARAHLAGGIQPAQGLDLRKEGLGWLRL